MHPRSGFAAANSATTRTAGRFRPTKRCDRLRRGDRGRGGDRAGAQHHPAGDRGTAGGANPIGSRVRRPGAGASARWRCSRDCRRRSSRWAMTRSVGIRVDAAALSAAASAGWPTGAPRRGFRAPGDAGRLLRALLQRHSNRNPGGTSHPTATPSSPTSTPCAGGDRRGRAGYLGDTKKKELSATSEPRPRTAAEAQARAGAGARLRTARLARSRPTASTTSPPTRDVSVA